MARNSKSPWRKENAVSTANQGKKYGKSSDSELERGERRKAIEDRRLARELGIDPEDLE